MADDLTAVLRTGLREAMSAGDRPMVSAFRTALATLANAEAVPSAEQSQTSEHRHVAGSVAGLGATEAARRVLSEAEQRDLIAAEVADLRRAADTRAQAGRAADADDLRRAAAALEGVIRAH